MKEEKIKTLKKFGKLFFKDFQGFLKRMPKIVGTTVIIVIAVIALIIVSITILDGLGWIIFHIPSPDSAFVVSVFGDQLPKFFDGFSYVGPLMGLLFIAAMITVFIIIVVHFIKSTVKYFIKLGKAARDDN